MADDFRESMMNAFVFEMNTLLGDVEQLLLRGDREPSQIMGEIPELFRIMHTIKSSCAMMSMGAMASVAHAAEDLLHCLRENPPSGIDSEGLMDLLLGCVDFLRRGMDAPEINPEPCVARVGAFLKTMHAPPAPPSSLSEYRLTIFFLRSCQAAHLRAFEIHMRLKAVAEVLAAYPESGAEGEEQIVREEGFSIELRTGETLESIIRNIRKSPFVDEIIVHDESDAEPPAQAPAPPAPEEEKPSTQRLAGAHISIAASKLDSLVDLIGEITIAQMEFAHLFEAQDMDRGRQSLAKLERMIVDMQEAILSTRMVPMRDTFLKMQRVVRDMNKKQNKVSHLKISGEETEVDKSIIDTLTAPLVHLIRNSIDHGMECADEREAKGKPAIGTVQLSASTEGRDVVITVADDGRGYDKARILETAIHNGVVSPESAASLSDKEILSLVMLPGFSTNTQITEFSGRGVGMDVVYSAVKDLHGKIQIDSELGKGTRTTLKVPLTMAIIDAFIVRAGGHAYAIPVASAQEVFRARDVRSAQVVNGRQTVFLRGVSYPVVDLSAFLGIVAKAVDPYEARDRIIEHRPDVMITDVHMSRMSGIDFTRKLLPQYYLPVIIISSDASMEKSAQATGAVSFLRKPNASSPKERSRFLLQLTATIRVVVNHEPAIADIQDIAGRIIAIGASTGGAEAIHTVIGMLPSVMPPIVIAQHMPPRFTRTFAERLNRHCALSVREAEEGDLLLPGQVYIAPGGCHTTVTLRDGRRSIALRAAASGQGACPSIDLLLSSVAGVAQGQALGIILTGMGRDGTEGLLALHDSGNRTLVQDEATSVVYGMPKAAYAAGAADRQLPIGRIAEEMCLFSGVGYNAGITG